uniref:fibroblast growth factor receptor 1-like isoform X1 n=1 Tax=Styela clava TaxID=7725 RepID=UPI00193AB0DC|nr:fibroblast growth factor receptor 1-like isoform X1 [Styela clava]
MNQKLQGMYASNVLLFLILNTAVFGIRDMKECKTLANKKAMSPNGFNGSFIRTGWLMEILVEKGETAAFTCNHIGFRDDDPAKSPDVELHWFHGTEEILPNERIKIMGCNKRPFILGTRMFIENVTITDVGKYHCKLWLKGGYPNDQIVFEEDMTLRIKSYRPTGDIDLTTNSSHLEHLQGSRAMPVWIVYIAVVSSFLIVITISIYCCVYLSIPDSKNSQTTCLRYICKKLLGFSRKNKSDEEAELAVYYTNSTESKEHEVLTEKDLELFCTKYSSVFPFLTESDVEEIFKMEISRERLHCNLEHSMPIVLGTGNFGQVYAGTVTDSRGSVTHVAVKRLNEGYRTEELGNFLREVVTLMKAGRHVNVISLVGTIVLDTLEGKTSDRSLKVQRPPILVMELATGGNLRKFLHDNRFSFTPSQISRLEFEKDDFQIDMETLLSFGHQISKGMEHLSNKNILHRDLAARNVLLTEDLVVKIADFGLSKFMTDEKQYYRVNNHGITPAKWTAPESLWTSRFTVKSDVWSYGVLLWEILTLGNQPYATVPACKLYEYLTTGNRLKRPNLASFELYEIMLMCWSWDPKERPDFTILSQMMKRILVAVSNQPYIEFANARSRLTAYSTERDSGLSCGNSSMTETESFDSMSERTYSATSCDTYTSTETVIAKQQQQQRYSAGIVYEIMNPLYENQSTESIEVTSPEYVNEANHAKKMTDPSPS